MTKQRCDVCNSIMFEATPFKTTQRDIIEFAQKSSLPEEQKQSILQNRWIHPGYYCPNGCRTVLVESPIPLPPMSLEKQIATATTYVREHFPEFLKTHGATSRIVCCAFCQKFGGAILEDQSPTALYRQPDHSPFRNKKIISAECSNPRIRNLATKWWHSKGTIQAECRYFEYETSFRWIYKSVTGWSEYASE